MNYKKFMIDDRRKIEVIDDVFTAVEKFHMYQFMCNSKYSMVRTGGIVPEREAVRKTLKCDLTLRECLSMGIFSNEFVAGYIKTQAQQHDLRLQRCYIVLCTSGDTYQYHIDSEAENTLTGLYYGNIEWHPEWEGETHFSDENMSEILYTSSFVPSRLVFFDGTIPHKSSQPSAHAPYYRFALTMKFVKKGSPINGWDKAVSIEDFYYDPKPTLTRTQETALRYIANKTVGIQHSGSTLYDHLYKTFCVLKELGASEDAQLAGMFHSIYETEYFKHNVKFDKAEVAGVIGNYANNLVNFFCMDGREQIIGQNTLGLDNKILLDLTHISYANAIEQAYRMDIPEEWFANTKNKILAMGKL